MVKSTAGSEQIPGAADGFYVTPRVVPDGQMTKDSQFGTIPEPVFAADGTLLTDSEAIAKRRLEMAETKLSRAQSNLRGADELVAQHKREHNGQNGDLSHLLDRTDQVQAAKAEVAALTPKPPAPHFG